MLTRARTTPTRWALLSLIGCPVVTSRLRSGINLAYAAVALKKGTAIAQTSGFRRFVEKHYRADWNVEWDEVFQTMYDQAPYRKDQETSSWRVCFCRFPGVMMNNWLLC